MYILNANKRTLVWGCSGKNPIDVYSNSNSEWQGIGLGQSGIESDTFPFEYQFRMKANWLEAAQDRLWLRPTHTQLKMKGHWPGTAQDRFRFISIRILNWNWKQLGLAQPMTESDRLLLQFQMENWSGSSNSNSKWKDFGLAAQGGKW